MIWLAIYLYVAGMPVSIHLMDALHPGKVKPRHRAVMAMTWPALCPVYAGVAIYVSAERLLK